MDASDRSPHHLLTTDEAAVALGVGVREVRKLCRLDQLRSRRVGRAIRVPWSAILEFTSGRDERKAPKSSSPTHA